MGKRKQLSIAGLFLIILSACTAGGLTGENPSAKPSVTDLPSNTPTETIVPTPTLINTVVALPSPTGGPPPDLELINLSHKYRENGDGTLIGEIRNNTATTMVFPGNGKNGLGIPILRFQMESWDWNGFVGIYWHHEFSAGKGDGNGWNTGCFLYPGETGLIRISTPGCQNYPENCKSESKIINEPPEVIGMRLVGYQDLKTYIPWPDLYPGYHPQVQNLEYSVTEHRLGFGFDLPKSIFKPFNSFMIWVVVYDEKGEMLGILYRADSEQLIIDRGGDNYRITGYYATDSDTGPIGNDYFGGELLDEDIDRIDHIRVMVERQHTYLCYTNKYDQYREYVSNHPE